MKNYPTFRDYQEASRSELKRSYGLTDREIEIGLRKVLDGANNSEMRHTYDEFYRRKES